MRELILNFILALITYGVYSGVLTLIGLSSTVMNILAIVIGFIWMIILYKLSVKIWK